MAEKAHKTLSQEIIDLVGTDPDSFDDVKESKLQMLLRPINDEMSIEKVTWRPRIGSW